MPVLIPPGDDRDALIRAGYASGRPVAEIAADVGVSKPVISRRAKALGVQASAAYPVAQTRNATVIRTTRIRDRLAQVADLQVEEIIRLHDLLINPVPAKVYDPDSQTWLEVETRSPTARDVSDLSRAIAALGRTALDIDDRLAVDPVADRAKAMIEELADAMGVVGPPIEEN